jgi:predicted transposase YbfD/YdcC
LETARAHWQIENALHWQLDVSLGEDAQRNRKDNGPANIAVLRRRALTTRPNTDRIFVCRSGRHHESIVL